jgi:hypothetical protein
MIVDAKDDVRDVDGEKPPEESRVADILQAGIHLSDSELILAIEQATPVPSQLQEDEAMPGGKEWLYYTLFLADEQGKIIYMPRIQLTGSAWAPNIFDSQAGASTPLNGEPRISGSTLTYSFPRELLPDLKTPFKWAVGTEWGLMSSPESSQTLTFGDQATEDDSGGYSGYPYEWADYPL